MKAPAFWWQAHPTLAARLLAPLGAVYGAATIRRMRGASVRAAVPVICVGNLVAGGAGKTPTVAALRAILAGRGQQPFVLSRGHGGRLAGPLLVDPAQHGAADVGDEPLMLSSDGPVVVSRDRAAGAALCIALGASVIVMDDGLQNPGLAKDLRIAVVDGAGGIGNGLCVPAGPLRAPLLAQWAWLDAVLVIGEGAAGARLAAEAGAHGKPVLTAHLEPDMAATTRLTGQRVIAFCGIGRPEKFGATLRGIGAEVAAMHAFADHHAYRPSELDRLAALAESEDCLLATTEKDAARLPASFLTSLGDRLVVVPVRLAGLDLPVLEPLIDQALVRGRDRP